MSLASGRYWREIRTRAWQDFREKTGGTVGLLVALAISFGAVAVPYLLEGPADGLLRLLIALVTPAVLLVVVTWQFITAPRKQYEEALQCVRDIEKQRDAESEKLNDARLEAEEERKDAV